MKTRTALVTALFALASFPLLAQRPPPAGQSNTPATQESPPGTGSPLPDSSTASPENTRQRDGSSQL
jgi:hypothetical protein